MLALEKPVRPGDQIEVKGASGTVVDIGIRSTRVLNANGTALIVPNGMLLSELVANRTLTDRTGEVLVQVHVPVTNDMEHVLGLVEQVVQPFSEEALRPPTVHLAEIGKAWALVEVRLWVHDVRQARDRRSEVLRRISHVLLAHGVDMDVAPGIAPTEDDGDPRS
jgi:small-conductance mechanosensitive channel